MTQNVYITPSQEAHWSQGAGAFVSVQIQDGHCAVGPGLTDHVGRVALVHSFIFLSQRVDLEIQQACLDSCIWQGK